ncbi:Sortilin- receptor [Crenichthys baileyi]|uniref:Sortilin- receptor n=1 Tax=Crenichthys baileyi TaxID=28760 RepID=A0AAV9SA61_9TELE
MRPSGSPRTHWREQAFLQNAGECQPDDDENRGLFLYAQKLTKGSLGIAGCLLAAGQRIGQGSNIATKGMAITFSTASKVKVWCRLLALRPVLLQIPNGSLHTDSVCFSQAALRHDGDPSSVIRSVGRNLASKPNVYISSSAGARWKEVSTKCGTDGRKNTDESEAAGLAKKSNLLRPFYCLEMQISCTLAGPHFYTWGDHGGILMAITQGGSTKHLKFSTNEGETWTEFKFSDKEVYVYQLLTEPGEKSTIFTIFGSYAEQRHSWLILQVNTSDVLGVPCSEADYKRWSPSDEHGNECLLGREITFKRRAPHATCFNGEDFDRPVTIYNCSCTRQDYECDYGFKLSEDLSLQVCVPDPEFLGDLYTPPVPCPIGTTYRRSKGYRRVPGDSCSGGDVEARLDGEMLPCPVGESNEFILYAVRNSIHRYDLATGTDQTLPLAGLREAVALDFDYDRNCLYWADISLDTIQRLCMNGSTGQEVIVRKDLQNVEALTFDPISRLLYWVDAGAQKIEVSETNILALLQMWH